MSTEIVASEVCDGSPLRLPSPIEVVQDEARLQGFTISDQSADYILWEKTGWPSFWRKGDGDTLEECIRTQAREFFESSEWRGR